ncbi:hypothetical protein K435DRAFT_813809 [Dendrothele bispora CBS 962.96]|uniref:Uncharacterized protein n=1 Tax=Dendrothele bispora (strain CBS 962.96) TaxID=1314807 RepID=A0A4S8KKT6_DENBC|nr:hypothetical protein K435DRAFT_813809 [Dendrothele bispora CBS 962.96]
MYGTFEKRESLPEKEVTPSGYCNHRVTIQFLIAGNSEWGFRVQAADTTKTLPRLQENVFLYFLELEIPPRLGDTLNETPLFSNTPQIFLHRHLAQHPLPHSSENLLAAALQAPSHGLPSMEDQVFQGTSSQMVPNIHVLQLVVLVWTAGRV